ncbi:tetratricopeptide repeat protein [Saccharopolyspora sp. K220]|uniref:AfsR/SARP family transcriptional regulator n=1 Tax=Saccharopolyspora soli TaxID=2926618 RepID=UPI001F56436F|nr:tetratricopeptide repeat protein [Saccharopolyspora soli]MCI2421248.1 tetratricopeptide repeat protein [Saccharopolyspora soli]
MNVLFKVLGPTSVRINEEFDDRWGKRQERGLLGVLLVNTGTRLSADELATWLWDADTVAGRLPNLRSLVSKVRTSLNDRGFPDLVHGKQAMYWVDVDRDLVDYHYLRSSRKTAAAAIDEGAYQDALTLLDDAIDLWRGVPLVDLDSQRADRWRLQLVQEVLAARCSRMECQLALEQYEDVLSELEGPLAERHAWDPRLATLRMRALHGLGRHGDITPYFLSYWKDFRDQTGSQAPDSVREVHEELTQTRSSRRPALLDLDEDEQGEEPEQLATGLLPPPVWDFRGRADLLNELTGLAQERSTGVVAIDGPAGIGKTTLVVEWAHQAVETVVDKVLFVDLQGYSRNAPLGVGEAVAALLTQLGVAADRIPSSTLRTIRLRQRIERQRTLVVLDNARDSVQVRPLLEVLSGCLVVVTSRKHLDGLVVRNGAHHIEVPALGWSEVFGWFHSALNSRFLVEPRAAEKLVALCEGIPLLVRIVSQHAATRPLQSLISLVEELQDRRVLLKLGGADDEGATVEAVLNCSYRALEPDKQLLLRLIGRYPGSVLELGAAAALTDWSPDVVRDALDVLVALHLVDRIDGSRYRLHDLIHDYAAELTNEDDATAIAATRRLADWFLWTIHAAARVIFPSRQSLPMEGFNIDVRPHSFADYEDAMEWCGRRRHELVAAAADAHIQRLNGHCWRMGNGAWEIMRLQGFFAEAEEMLNIALEAAREEGDLLGVAGSLNNLGLCKLLVGNTSGARHYLGAAAGHFASIGELFGLHSSQHNLASCEMKEGNLEAALEIYSSALRSVAKDDEPYRKAGTLRRIAEVLRLQGRYRKALANCRDAIWLYESAVNDSSGYGDALAELALIYHANGDPESARSYAHRALAVTEAAHDVQASAVATGLIAEIALNSNRYAEAVRYGRQTVACHQRLSNALEEAAAWDLVALSLEGMGRTEAAQEGRARARDIRNDLDAQVA